MCGYLRWAWITVTTVQANGLLDAAEFTKRLKRFWIHAKQHIGRGTAVRVDNQWVDVEFMEFGTKPVGKVNDGTDGVDKPVNVCGGSIPEPSQQFGHLQRVQRCSDLFARGR